MEKISQQEVTEVLQVFDFLEFSKGYSGNYYNNYFVPDVINRSMQTNTMQPIEVIVKELEQALKNPVDAEDIIKKYSMTFENQNMYYKRLLDYISGLPAFNLTFSCINMDDDFNEKEYLEDLKILKDFTTMFDYREELFKALRQAFRQGVFFSVLRRDGIKYTLQELPSDLCQITGDFNYGLLFDFDMSYFMNVSGVDIDMYPPIFKKMYRKVFNNMNKAYNPAKDLEHRDSTFSYMIQCNPYEGFWCFKIRPELTTISPYFSPLFPDMASQPIVRQLQEDKYFIEASKLLVGILGFNKDLKSGTVPNQMNITPEVLGKFLGLARQGLKKQIGLTALPVDDIEVVEFDTKDRNMLTEHIKNISDQSISSSATLLDNNKLNVHQSKLASQNDINLVQSMYPMFANMMSFFINNLTKKYKFSIKFNDFNTPDDLQKRHDLADSFVAKSATNWELLARLNNKNIFEYKDQIINENILFKDINSKFVHLENFYTQSDNSGGRPPETNSDNDNTNASNERNSNELR